MSFWAELARRNVFKVAAAYAIVAWLIAQVATVFAPALSLPAWVAGLVVFLLVLGFPVALILAWAYEITPGGIKKTRQVPLERSIARMTGQKLNYVVTGLLALAVLFLVADRYYLADNLGADNLGADNVDGEAARERTSVPSAAEPLAESEPVAQPGRRNVLANSVAVLPFANLSPNPENEYFAAGIHEEILNYLAKISALKVIARTSVLRYANTQSPILEIARELNVETVMEGSVRYANDQVRITVQLIDPETGAHLWSEAYQRDLGDIFAIQADIAMNVANALEAEFSPSEQARIEEPRTGSPEAYAYYLQALALSADLARMGPLLEQAVAVDPDFAAAHGRLAELQARSLIDSFGGTAVARGRRAEVERSARDHAARAIALDPEDTSAHFALGLLDMFFWRWEQARDHFDRAYRSANRRATMATVYAWLEGNPSLAIERSRANLELNPVDFLAHFDLGNVYSYAGDYDAAAARLQASVDLLPAFDVARVWLGAAELVRGNRERAVEELRLAEPLTRRNAIPTSLASLAHLYSMAGEPEDARRLFAEIEALAADSDSAGMWATAYLAIGDDERALEWLERGAGKARRHELDTGFPELMNLRLNPFGDPRLDRPRFVEVRSRLIGD